MSRIASQNFWLAVVLAAPITLFCWSSIAGPAKAEPAQGTAKSDPRRDMITALPALSAHPTYGDQARLFDRFVGTWDADYANYAADGSVTRTSGEVIFGWIIDGRALQDIWISYPKDAPANERNIGTTVRFYDTKSGMWRVVWVYPANGTITTLTGGAVGDRIVLRGQGSDGSLLRWSFNDIQPDSFVWRGETSHNSGETWRVSAEYHIKRRIPASTR